MAFIDLSETGMSCHTTIRVDLILKFGPHSSTDNTSYVHLSGPSIGGGSDTTHMIHVRESPEQIRELIDKTVVWYAPPGKTPVKLS